MKKRKEDKKRYWRGKLSKVRGVAGKKEKRCKERIKSNISI